MRMIRFHSSGVSHTLMKIFVPKLKEVHLTKNVFLLNILEDVRLR